MEVLELFPTRFDKMCHLPQHKASQQGQQPVRHCSSVCASHLTKPRLLFLELFPLFVDCSPLRIHRRHTLTQALPLGLALLLSPHEETFS